MNANRADLRIGDLSAWIRVYLRKRILAVVAAPDNFISNPHYP
jgi:hypothetical protein